MPQNTPSNISGQQTELVLNNTELQQILTFLYYLLRSMSRTTVIHQSPLLRIQEAATNTTSVSHRNRRFDVSIVMILSDMLREHTLQFEGQTFDISFRGLIPSSRQSPFQLHDELTSATELRSRLRTLFADRHDIVPLRLEEATRTTRNFHSFTTHIIGERPYQHRFFTPRSRQSPFPQFADRHWTLLNDIVPFRIEEATHTTIDRDRNRNFHGFTTDIAETPYQYRFFTPWAIPVLPDIGKNAKRLKEIDPNAQIPEGYTCNIIAEIMTDPVRDPNQPNYVFEKTAILKALESRPVNPFTNTELNPEDLIPDNVIKNKIEEYMENVEEEYHLLTNCYSF